MEQTQVLDGLEGAQYGGKSGMCETDNKMLGVYIRWIRCTKGCMGGAGVGK